MKQTPASKPTQTHQKTLTKMSPQPLSTKRTGPLRKPQRNISLPPSTGLHNTVDQLQHSLALLQLEIVELSEQVHALTTKDTEQLREQLDQIRNQLKISIQEFKWEMNTLYQDRETFKKDRKELQQTMGKELSEMKDYMGRELACFKVELQQRDRQIETLTTQMRCLSIPTNAPKDPPPSPTPTQPNPSSTPPAPTKSSHPSNSQREASSGGAAEFRRL